MIGSQGWIEPVRAASSSSTGDAAGTLSAIRALTRASDSPSATAVSSASASRCRSSAGSAVSSRVTSPATSYTPSGIRPTPPQYGHGATVFPTSVAVKWPPKMLWASHARPHCWQITGIVSRTGFRGDLDSRMLSWGEEIFRCYVETEEVPRGAARAWRPAGA